jgi:hypothetical protein
VVIDNSGTLDDLVAKLDEAWQALQARRAARGGAR